MHIKPITSAAGTQYHPRRRTSPPAKEQLNPAKAASLREAYRAAEIRAAKKWGLDK